MKFINKIDFFSTNITVRNRTVQYSAAISYLFIAINYLIITQIVTPITTLVMARETATMVIFDVVSGKSGESINYSGRKKFK